MGSQGSDALSRLVFLPLLQPSHPTPKQLALSTTYLELREADDLEGHFPGVVRVFCIARFCRPSDLPTYALRAPFRIPSLSSGRPITSFRPTLNYRIHDGEFAILGPRRLTPCTRAAPFVTCLPASRPRTVTNRAEHSDVISQSLCSSANRFPSVSAESYTAEFLKNNRPLPVFRSRPREVVVRRTQLRRFATRVIRDAAIQPTAQLL